MDCYLNQSGKFYFDYLIVFIHLIQNKDKLPDFNDIYDHLREQKIGKEFKRFQVVYGLPGKENKEIN